MTMKTQELTQLFYDAIAPSLPNEWEVEELLYPLKKLNDDLIRQLFSHIDSIWPISHTLCFRYIEYTADQIEIIGTNMLSEWVRWLLSQYEEGGLRKAEAFMSDAKNNFINRLHSSSQVTLAEISPFMTCYIEGVCGYPLRLEAAKEVWSDTETIFLPPLLDLFSTREDNLLVYKLLISLQWSLIALKSCQFLQKAHPAHFRDSTYPVKLYLLSKGLVSIRHQLPGLWRRVQPLVSSRLTLELSEIDGDENILNLPGINMIPNRHRKEHEHAPGTNISNHFELSLTEYRQFKKKLGKNNSPPPPPFFTLLLGNFHLQKTEAKILERRTENKKLFIKLVSKALKPTQKADDNNNGNQASPEKADSLAMLSDTITNAVKEKKQRAIIQLNNASVALPYDLLDLSSKIINDLGSIPEGYVQAAVGINGQGQLVGTSAPKDDKEEQSSLVNFVYDEWDCRRGGYRKAWCTIIEEPLILNKNNFTELTLTKYKGLRRRLRRQFEMMRTDHRFVGRQRDGDDLDLDAIIDAIGDKKAGKSPSERLFTRLLRNKRNIAGIFLVDMSNSTAGWVGTMIKESLVLLCEAMEILGDEYGIYGFSGMRRSRCKLYPIKQLDEPFSDSVQQRIAAIGPKDYTRMAPPIRHLTDLLAKSDARTRLLISLSDGKPEDYDGYFGQYAIEDTRKALLEARGKGIKSFCFTIDKQAHDYLEHMFGRGNYTFINNIEKLPSRIPQIYRTLTA